MNISAGRSEVAIRTAYDFAERIEARAESLIELLLRYEGYATACDEIERTISCLRNLNRELPYLEARIPRISSFLPLNQPLYALTLFAIVPSLMAIERVFVRPPVVARQVVRAIIDCLEVAEYFPRVEVLVIERQEFLARFVKYSDAVLFIGKHANALKVLSVCKKSALFIYSGAGVNPIIIGADSNLDHAANKVIEAKTYNSGQDCAAPDAVLVHSEVADEFLQRLITKLQSINVGEYQDRRNRVGPLVDHSAVLASARFIYKHRGAVTFGGLINAAKNIVYPTVVQASLPNDGSYEELYAPVLFVARYGSGEDMLSYFDDSRYLEHAMYASVFGNVPLKEKIRRTTLLENQTVLDVEQGNLPFGGFGGLMFLR